VSAERILIPLALLNLAILLLDALFNIFSGLLPLVAMP
jgi:hypothetical protein